jgi:hypothetical protein
MKPYTKLGNYWTIASDLPHRTTPLVSSCGPRPIVEDGPAGLKLSQTRDCRDAAANNLNFTSPNTSPSHRREMTPTESCIPSYRHQVDASSAIVITRPRHAKNTKPRREFRRHRLRNFRTRCGRGSRVFGGLHGGMKSHGRRRGDR